jgi:hypothetical protein
MKISKETINVLKNFATISNNLRIYPGNVLATLSPQTNIFAKCEVPDTFPVDASIYNLNSLLELLSMYDDQEIEFGDKQLSISKDGGKFDYTYADPSVIIAPPAGKTIELDSHYTFNLTATDIIMINKAAGITGAEQISLIAKDGKVSLVVGDKANSMKHAKDLGATDLTFTALLDVGNFRVTPEAYTVTLSQKKFLHFKSAAANVPEYWLALDPKSVIPE